MKNHRIGAVLAAFLLMLPSVSVIPTDAENAVSSEAMTRLQYAAAAYDMLLDAEAIEAGTTKDRPFEDTDAAAVSALYRIGVIQGTSETAFSPEASLTREEAAVILGRLASFLKADFASDTGTPFEDDIEISDWAKDSVYTMRAAGLINGTGENTFSPSSKLTVWQGVTLLVRLQKQVLPEAITRLSYQDALASVTKRIRWVGTEGEQETAAEIADAMESWGYRVEKQSFPFQEYTEGKQTSTEATNVIAVKEANQSPNQDILILSAHHDSMPSTVGANDNASGTAMLLELARTLKDIDTDTEIRFISFAAEEQGLKGSAYYTARLSDEEKARIIGVVELDMIGHYRSQELLVKTPDGSASLIGNLLTEASEKVTGTPWKTGIESASDHMSFIREGIPAVLVEQDNLGTENHRASDKPVIIDAAKALPAGKTISRMVKEIASPSTASYAKEAHAMFQADSAIQISDRVLLLTGLEKAELDVLIGAAGVFEKSETNEYDWQIDHYLINAKWFSWDTTLPTDFTFRNQDGSLTLFEVFIRTESLGLDEKGLAQKLTDTFGKPEADTEGTPVWNTDDLAENPSGRQWMITKQDGVQALKMVEVFRSEVGIDLKAFDFSRNPSEYAGSADAAELALLETMHKIIPPGDPYIKQIISWTDGYSKILGTCIAEDMEKLDAFDIRIDRNDFFGKDGSVLNLDKLLSTMVHEYGHAITNNISQIDPTKYDGTPDFNDPAVYRDGSYLQAFYDHFYAQGAAPYQEKPEDYVNEYASSKIFEDIAETFMVFVTSDKPQVETLADQKVNFFYDYPELVEIRAYIRSNFGFPERFR